MDKIRKGGRTMKRLLVLLLSVSMISGLFTFGIGNASADENEETVGTTYYVSSLNGDNNADGKSPETAWESVLKINDITLQPGDKVLLEKGSVFNNQYLHIKGSGDFFNSITIGAYGDEDAPKPVINAKGQGVWYQDYGVALDNAQHISKGYVSSAILLYDVEYIEISGLEIINDVSFENEDYSLREKMNRTGVAVVAQNAGTIDSIVLDDLYIHDVKGNVYDKHMNNGGIYFTAFLPDDEASTGIPKYNDVTIQNCYVKDVSRWGIALAYTAYYAQFSDAEIDDAVCQKYGATNVVIRNNYVKDAGGDAITTMYCYQPIVEYNVADGVAKEINTDIYSATDFGRVAAGIWPWKCKDAVFQYNEVFDTCYNGDAQAWDADWGDGTVYQYNYSHNNQGGAVMVCGVQAINTVFRYNISYKDLTCALDLPDNAPKAEFYNNVFYMAEGVPFLRIADRNDGANQTGTAVLMNNIIYNSGAEKEENWNGKNNTANMTYSNNLYYNYTNVPEGDENAVIEDPMFLDAASAPTTTTGPVHDREAFEGFKVYADSPAIDAGTVIDGFIGTDFFGNEVTGTPDIGVYEYHEGDVPSGKVDKTELLAEIEKAKALEDYTNANGTYTEVSYSKFSEALEKAIEVSESETATRLDVIAAKNSLSAAIEELVKVDPNFYMYKEDFTVNTSGAWLQWSSTDGQLTGVTSEEAANDIMFDGKEAGFWLSQNDVPDIYIDIVFGDTSKTVKGIEYVSRENGNNKINTVEILASENGKDFTSAGAYTPEYNGQTAEIIFDKPITAKYIRLKPTAIANDGSTEEPNKLAVSELRIIKLENEFVYGKGDVNHSGAVEITDATAVQKYLVRLDNIGVFDVDLADMNDDNAVTIFDATLIQIQLAKA